MIASLMMTGLLLATVPAPAAAQTDMTAHWAAPASTEIVVEERTFRSGDAELSGTLYLPKSTKPVGAMVVLHGASDATRDRPLYSHLKTMMPALGIAVFVYDRRGSGKSGGDLKTSDYVMLADDGIAAQRMLAADPRIDARRIGAWGLSQGGWLTALMASRSPDLAYAVSISAPMVTPDVQMIFASENILRVNGYDQAEIDQMVAMRKAIDNYLRGKGERETAQRALDAGKVKPWFNSIFVSSTLGDPRTSRWLKEMLHDPMPTLDKVKAPTLIIYGAVDPWVPAAISMQRLNASAQRHPNVDTVVIAGADHTMQLSVSPKDQMNFQNAAPSSPDSQEYFGVLASWLTRYGFARPVR